MNINESEQIVICTQTQTQSHSSWNLQTSPCWSLGYQILLFTETTLSAPSADTLQSVALMSTVGLPIVKKGQMDHSPGTFVKPSLVASRFGFFSPEQSDLLEEDPKGSKAGGVY